MKQASLSDFLMSDQIDKALCIWREDNANFHKRVVDEIIMPALPDINRKLGQENNADFLAYAMEYVFNQE